MINRNINTTIIDPTAGIGNKIYIVCFLKASRRAQQHYYFNFTQEISINTSTLDAASLTILQNNLQYNFIKLLKDRQSVSLTNPSLIKPYIFTNTGLNLY